MSAMQFIVGTDFHEKKNIVLDIISLLNLFHS